MLRLDRIHIQGFKTQHNNVELCLSDEKATVIFGDNGCGKTTFLKIIHAVLSKDESTLLSEDVNKVEIDYRFKNQDMESRHSVSISKIISQQENLPFDDEELLSASDPDEVSRYLLRRERLRKQQEYQYDWTQFENSHLIESRSISLGVDRGIPSSRVNVSPQYLYTFIKNRRSLNSNFRTPSQLHEFVEELSEFITNRNNKSKRTSTLGENKVDHIFIKEINMDNVEQRLHARYRSARRNAARRVQNALFDTLALAVRDQQEQLPSNKTEITEDFETLIFENKELIIEALDDSQENSFKDIIIAELNKINDIDDVSDLKENHLLSKLLLKMSEELKDTEEELFAVNTVIDRFDTFTSKGKTLKVNIDEIKVSSKAGDHSINELSSGERHILTLFTLLLDQGRGRDFIIIDEPEISLNTKWQEILLPTLSEILPNSQIIVASHSPVIAESIDNLAELVVS